MKNLILFILTFAFSILSILLPAQLPHLDVEGHTKIRGNIDINHPDDTTSVFIGRKAGINTIFTTRKNNTFVGSNAGYSNTSGGDNSFFGVRAGRDNIDGGQNSFFGFHAGINNQSGDNNCFFGYATGGSNQNGHSNSFFGNGAGCEQVSGNFNSFFGNYAGEYNISGSQNSFFGESSGGNNISGTRNTYLGTSADQVGDSLDRAIAIGYKAKVGCSHCAVIGGTGEDAVNVGIGTENPTERLHVNGKIKIGSGETLEDAGGLTIAINSNLFPTTDNFVSLGNESFRWKDVWAVDGSINSSDVRNKTNIRNLDYGLGEVLKLRSVRYQWKDDPTGPEKLGLIAQDLLKVIPEVVKTHAWIITEKSPKATGQKVELERYGVYYTDLIPVLVKAIQEQNEEISKLEIQVHKMKNLQEKLNKIEAQLEVLTKPLHDRP
jgi:hypothetical protein